MKYILPEHPKYHSSKEPTTLFYAGYGVQFHFFILCLIIAKKYNLECLAYNFSNQRNYDIRYNSFHQQKNDDFNIALDLKKRFKTIDSIDNYDLIDVPNVPTIRSYNDFDKIYGSFFTKYFDLDKNIIFRINDVKQIAGNTSEDSYLFFDILSEIYWESNEKYKFDNEFNIAIHLRRGDVLPSDTIRTITIAKLLNNVNKIKKVYPNASYHVISENNLENLDLLRKNNINVHINNTDLEALNILSSADILYRASHSSFSEIAAIFNPNIIIYDNLATSKKDRHNSFIKYNNINKKFYHLNELI